MRLANWTSFGITVSRFAWIAAKLAFSNMRTTWDSKNT